MSLQLIQHTTADVPLEAENLCPDRLVGLSIADIEKLPVQHGNQPAVIGDFFNVAGEAGERLIIDGDLILVKYIGAGMRQGRITVNGDVGPHLGAGMSGGIIEIKGNAGDWVAPEMRGGRVVIRGNAGHMVGSAYRGSPVGILGGEIIIHGNVRNEVGNAMRAGLIAIGGDSGDFTGVNMLAGAIFVLGELGIRAGAGMKRGSIVSFKEAEILPTFSYACTYRPGYLSLYLRYLAELGLEIGEQYLSGLFRRYCGDGLELNRGEIVLYSG